jgi:hypothetical protein
MSILNEVRVLVLVFGGVTPHNPEDIYDNSEEVPTSIFRVGILTARLHVQLKVIFKYNEDGNLYVSGN